MTNLTLSNVSRTVKTLLLLGGLSLGTAAMAAGTAANTPIDNVGVFDYTDDAGAAQTVSSTPVSITVLQVAGLTIAPDGTVASPGQTVYGTPGQNGVLTYTITNTGNGPDTMQLTTTDGNGNALPGITYYYDAALTQPVPATGVPLTADQTKTIYASVPVSTTAVGGANIYVDPVGTSTFAPTTTDSNNVGLVTTTNVHTLTLTTDNALNLTTPGSAIGTHTLTNTGNTPLVSGQVTATPTVTDANAIIAGISYVFTNGTNAGAAASDPTTALNNYLSSVGPLAAGQSITLNTTYTAAAGKAAGQTATDALKVYFTAATTSADAYNTTSANAVPATDTLTIIKGLANVVKTVDNCGTDVSCASPALNATTAKPKDYLRYTITVTNAGTAPLKTPVLHDTLNANLTYISAVGSTSQTGTPAPAVLYGTAAPTSTTAPTTLAAGGTLYAGLNTTGGTTGVSSADQLGVGQTFTVVIITQVK